jgi:hypothetical protein
MLLLKRCPSRPKRRAKEPFLTNNMEVSPMSPAIMRMKISSIIGKAWKMKRESNSVEIREIQIG